MGRSRHRVPATVRLLLLATLFGVWSGSAAAAGRIVSGVLSAAFPEAGALLVGNDPATATAWCSGVLIGCRTFLTAAHCVCDSTGSRCQGAAAPSPAGRLVYLQHAGFFRVERIRVHPDFRFPVGDVAVLTLAAPVTGIRPAALATTAPPPGTGGTIVGFGRTSSTRNDYGLKRLGTITSAPCTGSISNATSVCWTYPDSVSDTCHGDSGGPLFVAGPSGPTVAGVTSGGTSDRCEPTDLAYDASVAAYHTWITATAAEPLGSQACGAVPQVGDAAVIAETLSGTLEPASSSALHAVDVPAGSHGLRFTLNGTDDGITNFDLFVRAGAPPTPNEYDCRAGGGSPYGTCEFLAPATGPWFALVRRVSGAGTYQVTVTRIGGTTPVCGNGQLDVGESCDGGDDAACPGSCAGTCVCEQRCTPGGVAILSVDLGPRLVVRARLHPSAGRNDTIDPRASDFRIVLTGGVHPLRLDIPAGDPGWARSRPARGRYQWRSGGRWNLVLARRPASRDGWNLTVTSRDGRTLDPSTPGAVGLEVSMGGACIGG